MAKHKSSRGVITTRQLRQEMRDRLSLFFVNDEVIGRDKAEGFGFLLEAVSEEFSTSDDYDVNSLDCEQLLPHFATGRTVSGQGGSGEAARAVRAATPAAPDLLTGAIPSTSSPYETPETVLQRGGFDGGIKVGFMGRGLPVLWERTLSVLEGGKKSAIEDSEGLRRKHCEGVPVVLGGEEVLVFPVGGKSEDLVYKYRFMVRGVEFLVHSNPQGDIQPIRIRYTAEALIGNNLYAVHNQFVRPFISSLGFEVSDEKLSRADFQILIDVPSVDFVDFLFGQQIVMKFRKIVPYLRSCSAGKRVGCETFTLGTLDKVQVCIYDKRQELRSHSDGLIKEQLFVEKVGGAWIDKVCYDLFERMNEFSESVELTTGICLGDKVYSGGGYRYLGRCRDSGRIEDRVNVSWGGLVDGG